VPRRKSRWLEYGRPALLLIVTMATVFVHGALASNEQGMLFYNSTRDGILLVAGVFSIMLAHEFGHYLACVYYGVDATLPHFLPAPPLFIGFGVQPLIISLTGTFGAFIRIREPFPNRRALFDIGVAGPLAGFIVTVAVLVTAIATGHAVPRSPEPQPEFLNFPLLFDLAERFVHIPKGTELEVNGSLLKAAWFGAFLTALNLFPVGQLDGGHAIYALLRRKAAIISRIGFYACVGLVYFSPSWIVWALLLFFVGRGHPVPIDDESPAGRGRAVVGMLCVAVFVLCFMPNPIHWGSWGAVWHDLRTWLGR
jgi:membrane-associated protease RseP (regulator of RpoE activity)